MTPPTPPTTLFLARHGQTVWHAENRYAGVSDVPLTDTGHAQAKALGRWAGAQPLDAVWTSPLSRAIATAEPTCRALGLTAHREDDLRECDFGVVEGRTLAEFEAADPAAAQAFRDDPVAHPFPGAENPRAAADRAAGALRRVAGTRPGGRILVVAHNTLLRLALCRLLGIPLADYRRVLPGLLNTAVTEIRLDGPHTALISLNVPCT
ncbi:histidine phosphatase family protein [Streptomyces sp. LP11]|uniref:Histidine phosphatase family protein n=1 Tax=Streptomyces pyxinicus TaxID=2970331 RepID=A0ABT2BCY2_9ACTN|nr:histidine phosphatase family protein [Streptomyces sp. LP11]MCS0606381.1 histidine phosphatase family protein [Streptomyces sp. LP11]